MIWICCIGASQGFHQEVEHSPRLPLWKPQLLRKMWVWVVSREWEHHWECPHSGVHAHSCFTWRLERSYNCNTPHALADFDMLIERLFYSCTPSLALLALLVAQLRADSTPSWTLPYTVNMNGHPCSEVAFVFFRIRFLQTRKNET